MSELLEGSDPSTMMQSIFNSTRCYDIMQESNKVIVFETNISFQLAFFALIEHGKLAFSYFLSSTVNDAYIVDTEAAPLWDPEKRQIIGIMTVSDYIYAVQICRINNVPLIELASKTINDMISMPINTIRFSDQQSIDAEDSIYQLYNYLERSNAEYVTVINPDEGNLVSVLGYMDILNLLQVACKQQPQLFRYPIQDIINTQYTSLTVPNSSKLCDVLRLLSEQNLLAIPVVDEQTHLLMGVFHKNDTSFIVRANDPDQVITNLNTMNMQDVLLLQQQGNLNGGPENIIPSPRQYSSVRCTPHDYVNTLIDLLVINRVTCAACVNENEVCIGLITIKDVLRCYFSHISRS